MWTRYLDGSWSAKVDVVPRHDENRFDTFPAGKIRPLAEA
jgi:hypothetical protein